MLIFALGGGAHVGGAARAAGAAADERGGAAAGVLTVTDTSDVPASPTGIQPGNALEASGAAGGTEQHTPEPLVLDEREEPMQIQTSTEKPLASTLFQMPQPCNEPELSPDSKPVGQDPKSVDPVFGAFASSTGGGAFSSFKRDSPKRGINVFSKGNPQETRDNPSIPTDEMKAKKLNFEESLRLMKEEAAAMSSNIEYFSNILTKEKDEINQGIVLEYNSSMAKKNAENAEAKYYSEDLEKCDPIKEVKEEVSKEKQFLKNRNMAGVFVKSAAMIEADENKETNKLIWKAERDVYERKICPLLLANACEFNYQIHLQSTRNQQRVLSEKSTTFPTSGISKVDTARNLQNEVREEDPPTLDLKTRDSDSSKSFALVAELLKVEVQRMTSVKAAYEAEARYWEKTQRQLGIDKNQKDNLPRSDGSDVGFVDTEMCRNEMASSFKGDTSEKDKLSYAQIVVKGEEERKALLELNIAQCLKDEYQKLQRVKNAEICEAIYQTSLVSCSKPVCNKSSVKHGTENIKRKRKKQKEDAVNEVEEMTYFEGGPKAKDGKESIQPSHQQIQGLDRECQTEDDDKLETYTDTDMEENFAKRLKVKYLPTKEKNAEYIASAHNISCRITHDINFFSMRSSGPLVQHYA